jgi:hypothetical protein
MKVLMIIITCNWAQPQVCEKYETYTTLSHCLEVQKADDNDHFLTKCIKKGKKDVTQ